jgi:hypothetical protein
MAFVVPALFIPLQAESFWSRYLFYVHQNMTARALAPAFSLGTKSLEFRNTAIDALKRDVQRPDDEKQMGYSPNDHFDSERLVGSLTVLKQRRAQLIGLLSDANPYAHQADAWEHLGLIFHAIQDFYSHSTWLRSHATGTVDFATLTTTTAASPEWAKHQGEIGDVCLADGVTPSGGAGKVTTGYYPPFPREAGKCDHGDVKGWLANCVEPPAENFGLALDSSCSVALESRTLQRTAEARAEDETRNFTQAIIKQLVDAGKPEGACALAGVPLNECPIDVPACTSTANDIPPDWDYAFRYAITQFDGIQTIDRVTAAGGRQQNVLSIDVTSGASGRLRLWTGGGLDSFHVVLKLRTTAPYQSSTVNYTLEGVGAELWNAVAESCLFAEFADSDPFLDRGCFPFSGSMTVVRKGKPFCTRDGLFFSNVEVSFEGTSPSKANGARVLGPVKVDNSVAKGVFVECARGTPTAIGAKGNDQFTCSAN